MPRTARVGRRAWKGREESCGHRPWPWVTTGPPTRGEEIALCEDGWWRYEVKGAWAITALISRPTVHVADVPWGIRRGEYQVSA